MAPKRTETTPAQYGVVSREFTSHQRELRRPTVHTNPALLVCPEPHFLVYVEWFGLAGGLMLCFWHFFSLSHSLPGSKRFTRVAGAGCHSVGVTAAEE